MGRPAVTTDFVAETKAAVKDLIAEGFPGATIYLADYDNIPRFNDAGTFCLEAASSGVEVGAQRHVVVTIRVWTYVEAADAAVAEEALTARAQRLEGLLAAAGTTAPAPGSRWLKPEALETVYQLREKGRLWRRQYLRAARTEWRVKLAACR